MPAESSSKLFLVCCVKLCSFDSWSSSRWCTATVLSRAGAAQEGRAPVWLWRRAGVASYAGRGALQHGRARLFLRRLGAMIPMVGGHMGMEMQLRCVRNRIAIIFSHARRCCARCSRRCRVVPCGNCMHPRFASLRRACLCIPFGIAGSWVACQGMLSPVFPFVPSVIYYHHQYMLCYSK